MVFNVSTKQCAALLLSRFLFCSSLNHEGLQIFNRLCSANLCFKSFHYSSDGSFLSAQRCFDFHVLPILFKSQLLKHFQSFGSLLLKVWFWTFLCCFHGSFLSAQRCFVFHFLPILFKSQCWNCLRVSVDYTCKCNAEISLWFSMSPLNSALLCFSRASCFVQVSIMKVFKSSIDYALRNFVSNLSLVFCWSFLSAQRCFAFHFLPILFKFQSQNFLRVSVDCFWRFDSELFCVVFTEVSCRHSAALIFMFFLFCSSLNVETFREYRWTTLANLMLRLLFGFQCLH